MNNQKILVIDDEEPITMVVKASLEDKYDVATTNSALSAFKFMSNNKVDLVLLDIKMPAISGIEALKEIKKIHPKTDVIMLTAYASEDNKQKAKELGAYGFITKPFDVSELRSYIDRVLTRNGNSKQRA